MSPHRVALLFLWDVVVDVFIAPVKQQLLFLSVIDPHDGKGELLDDAQQVSQVHHPRMGHFSTRKERRKDQMRRSADTGEY